MRSLRLCVEDLLTDRGWHPVERIIGRKVNVFFEHPDFKGTFGAIAAAQAQMRREETHQLARVPPDRKGSQ